MVVASSSVFNPGAKAPFVVSEVGMGSTCREHERVVGLPHSIVENDLTRVLVDTFHFRHQGVHFRAISEEIANRPGDLGCRK